MKRCRFLILRSSFTMAGWCRFPFILLLFGGWRCISNIHCQSKHRSKNSASRIYTLKYHCYPLLYLLPKLGLKITPFIIELSIFIHPKQNTNRAKHVLDSPMTRPILSHSVNIYHIHTWVRNRICTFFFLHLILFDSSLCLYQLDNSCWIGWWSQCLTVLYSSLITRGWSQPSPPQIPSVSTSNLCDLVSVSVLKHDTIVVSYRYVHVLQ